MSRPIDTDCKINRLVNQAKGGRYVSRCWACDWSAEGFTHRLGAEQAWYMHDCPNLTADGVFHA